MTGWLLINFIAAVAVTVYAIFLFGYLVKTRYAFIKLGKKEEFDQKTKKRIQHFLVNVFGQQKLLKDKKSGVIHVMFFYGFILVQLGALDFIVKGIVPGAHLPFGPFYGFFTFTQEMITVMILAAVFWAFYRRYIEKLARLKRGWKNGLVLFFISMLMVSVLAGNGMDFLMQADSIEFAWKEPVASAIAVLFNGLSQPAAMVLFYIMWWVHLLVLLAFLVYVPQSKHAHLIAAPLNTYFHRLKKAGKLRKIDFEDETQESFGAGKIEDFTQKQMIDLYACVECGRCTSMCPAAGTGKMLSPMELIVKLRDHLTFTGAAVTSRQPWVPAFAFSAARGNKIAKGIEPYHPQLIGGVITESEIWACTTCRSCEDQCPVMNEHVDKIIDMRRYLVLTEGKANPDAQRAMQNIERQGNPWGLNRKDKEKWRQLREDVLIPTMKEAEKTGRKPEFLFWVGSMGAFDSRSQKIALSFAKLLNEAGVSFAILGNKEKNSGDTPRRLGNEFLFQELAAANIAEFEKNNVKKIVTIDPHAYNVFKNEYPDFGFSADVYHHTELLDTLVKEGRLTPRYPVNEKVVFHDSCYLGRYNNVYDAPREILKKIQGVQLVEMKRNRQDSMCCGAGGGLMWMEEDTGQRVNIARTEQALAVTPSVVSSGCPFCLTMLSDGLKAKEAEETTYACDIAELLEKAVFGTAEKN